MLTFCYGINFLLLIIFGIKPSLSQQKTTVLFNDNIEGAPHWMYGQFIYPSGEEEPIKIFESTLEGVLAKHVASETLKNIYRRKFNL